MSHRDVVAGVPEGFSVLGASGTCAVAVMAEPAKRLYGVQFHPEVIHTPKGKELLAKADYAGIEARVRDTVKLIKNIRQK